MWQYQKTDELYHYGVLGMKCGTRRGIKALSGSTPEQRQKGVKILEK